jgi:hypothetical protein
VRGLYQIYRDYGILYKLRSNLGQLFFKFGPGAPSRLDMLIENGDAPILGDYKAGNTLSRLTNYRYGNNIPWAKHIIAGYGAGLSKT